MISKHVVAAEAKRRPGSFGFNLAKVLRTCLRPLPAALHDTGSERTSQWVESNFAARRGHKRAFSIGKRYP